MPHSCQASFGLSCSEQAHNSSRHNRYKPQNKLYQCHKRKEGGIKLAPKSEGGRAVAAGLRLVYLHLGLQGHVETEQVRNDHLQGCVTLLDLAADNGA